MMFADFARHLDFFPGKSRLIWIACAAAIIQAGLHLANPLTVNHIFDVSLTQHRFLPLVAAGGTLLLLYVLQAGVIVLSRLAILQAVKQTTAAVRGILNERLNSLSMIHLQHSDRGHPHNTVVADTERIDAIGNTVAAEIFPALLISISLCGLLIAIHWGLFLMLLLMLGPVVSILIYELNRTGNPE